MKEGLFTRLLYNFLDWTTKNDPLPDYLMKPHVALCIGHSRKVNGRTEGGAVSHDGTVNEWNFNLPLAILIRQKLAQMGFRAEIISEYEGDSYGSAQRWLAARLRALEVKIAVEFHFNSAGPSARGHEWLYWHSSGKGKDLAEKFSWEVSKFLPDLPARGIKPKNAGDRGAEFLKLTHCPAIIAEPGFGSNATDWAIMNGNQEKLASAYANAIAQALS